MSNRKLLAAAFMLSLMGAVLVSVNTILSSPSVALSTFVGQHRSGLLLYARLSNRILWFQDGVEHSITVGARAPHHHAYPAVSLDGRYIALIQAGTRIETEEVVVYDNSTNEESVLLTWHGAIWSTAWSPVRSELAFIADNISDSRQQSLYIIDLTTRKVTELTQGVKWVSNYSSPTWSPSGDYIAFERRFTDANGIETQSVMTVGVTTKLVVRVADGWYPSWFHRGNQLAYLSLDGKKLYQEIPAKGQKQLLFSYRNLLGQTIVGPLVWAPNGEGVIFNTTTGMNGDGRRSEYFDFASRKRILIEHDPNFEIVGAAGAGGPR